MIRRNFLKFVASLVPAAALVKFCDIKTGPAVDVYEQACEIPLSTDRLLYTLHVSGFVQREDEHQRTQLRHLVEACRKMEKEVICGAC